MELTINFRHLEHTEALDNLIKDKSKRLNKYLKDNARLEWTCLVEKDRHRSDLQVNNHGKQFHATATDSDLYKTIDQVIHKIEHQLHD